jgi:uncharacterized protein YbaP (TraB family)
LALNGELVFDRDRTVKHRFPWFLVLPAIALSSAAASSANAGTCCVWRLTNAKAPFYLVGSFHALSNKDYPLPRGYLEASQNSQRFLFEYNFKQDEDFGRKFQAAAKYPKGQDIRRHIHPQTYQYLIKAFRISNGDPNEFLPYKPWLLANLWGVRGYTDFRISQGVDAYMYRQAVKAGKEVGGVETVDEHVAVLSGMTDIEAELTLLDSILRYNKNVKGPEFDQMHSNWRSGNIDALWQQAQRDRKLNPGASARLVDMRNVKWVPRVRAEIQSSKPTAIVVGALHMPGPNGLIALLKRNGYKFEQL